MPNFLKQNFNDLIQYTFIECPTEDEKVAGCFIKNCIIDWEKFIKYCVENKKVDIGQKKILIKEGLYEEDRRRSR